jgi:hypothetical protein
MFATHHKEDSIAVWDQRTASVVAEIKFDRTALGLCMALHLHPQTPTSTGERWFTFQHYF